MGQGDPEAFRCRIYDHADEHEERTAAFVRKCAHEGAIDCPAHDPWVLALQERGWLPESPRLEPNPDGPGRIGRWVLTPLGRERWEQLAQAKGWAT
jgi:hypothetical protein